VVGGTYSNDFIRDPLSFAFSLLEICTTAIELSRVHVLIELSFDTKQFFIGGKLVPGSAIRSRSERIVVGLTSPTSRGAIDAGLPLLKVTFPCSTFLLADVSVRPECWKGKGILSDPTLHRGYYVKHSLSPFESFASAGPDDQLSMFVEAMKSWSFKGVPALLISFTSFNVTPVVSPSPLVEATTPS
jgi:hypothetical protein